VDDVVMTDWTGRTATEIAAAVRAGEATAGQVAACHLDRIAVQLVAAPGGEQALLALAAQLERAQPWPRHAPGYSGSLRPSWEASKPRDS
jgi:Asp-tRNA(Asn)/Glu-tRNA(Gln) amidotransferase A subunit family amidase